MRQKVFERIAALEVNTRPRVPTGYVTEYKKYFTELPYIEEQYETVRSIFVDAFYLLET